VLLVVAVDVLVLNVVSVDVLVLYVVVVFLLVDQVVAVPLLVAVLNTVFVVFEVAVIQKSFLENPIKFLISFHISFIRLD
tara:strand:- start:95 stop:334 length:240 start_codon:yes stop_codon:yes gene_type:complete